MFREGLDGVARSASSPAACEMKALTSRGVGCQAGLVGVPGPSERRSVSVDCSRSSVNSECVPSIWPLMARTEPAQASPSGGCGAAVLVVVGVGRGLFGDLARVLILRSPLVFV